MGKVINNFRELEKFRNQLRKHNLKATNQRIAVHEAMMNLGHASAEEVCRWIETDSEVNVTMTSVYNILSQMTSLGIYSNRMSADNKMYFDVNTTPHIHVYDCENHTYTDILDNEMYDNVVKSIGSRRFRGYKIESIDVQIVVRPTRKKKAGL